MILQIEPWIDNEELVQLKRVIDSTYVTESVLTAEFEEMIKKLTGARHAISMTNGTMALYVCLKALGVGPGDEVIIPDLTFIATANAVILAGAKPVFCDVLRDTFCMDVSKAKSLITSKTRVVIPVHLYGQATDMLELKKMANEHNLYVIEDAAQGVGVKFCDQHVGTFGDLGILSFYGNKTITCGEGGVVLTDDDNLAIACYRLKNHGRDKKGIFVHEEIGFNFAFTEMQAAIGISQLNKLGRIIEKKKLIHDRYVKELDGISGFVPCKIDSRVDSVYWFTSFECDSLEELSQYLLEKGVQTRRFFYPLHLQPCYQKMELISDQCRSVNFKVTDEVYQKGLSLPSAYSLSDDQQSYIINQIKSYYENRI